MNGNPGEGQFGGLDAAEWEQFCADVVADTVRIRDMEDGDPVSDEDAVTEAHAEQIDMAMREAGRYHCVLLPSGRGYRELRLLGPVYEMSTFVWGCYHNSIAGDRSIGSRLETFQEGTNRRPGTPLPAFDIGDPEHQRGVFAIMARAPHAVHVIKPDNAVEDLIERELKHHVRCDWGYVAPMCAGDARHFLMLSRGQFVIGTAVCFSCFGWLMHGAPADIEFPKAPRPHWGNIRQ